MADMLMIQRRVYSCGRVSALIAKPVTVGYVFVAHIISPGRIITKEPSLVWIRRLYD